MKISLLKGMPENRVKTSGSKSSYLLKSITLKNPP